VRVKKEVTACGVINLVNAARGLCVTQSMVNVQKAASRANMDFTVRRTVAKDVMVECVLIGSGNVINAKLATLEIIVLVKYVALNAYIK
jgi:hypothetical protein